MTIITAFEFSSSIESEMVFPHKRNMLLKIFLCTFLSILHGIFCLNLTIENVTVDDENPNILVELLNLAESVLNTAKQVAASNQKATAEASIHKSMDCAEIHEMEESAKSGIHFIWPRNRIVTGPVSVYCDMEDDGGAWTVIQRRGDFDSPKNYFYRDWNGYKTGFGDLLKDFWLGNNYIFALTNQRPTSVKFTLVDWEGNSTYATYDDFWIDDESHHYKMHVSGYRGTAGDSFSYTNDAPFSTKDKPNEKENVTTAITREGGWWYKRCPTSNSNLNGFYLKAYHTSYTDGVEWISFTGPKYSLKDSTIKIRPRDFKKG